MKKLFVLVITSFIMLMLFSCNVSEKPLEADFSLVNNSPINNTDSETQNIKSEVESNENNSKVAEILSKKKKTSFGCRLFGDNLAVECDGNIYVLYKNIMLLNSETGIRSLCTDPLCSHNNASCINTKT